MKHWDVFINPDGTVSSLYTDKMDWQEIGPIKVERVSNVEFDEGRQGFVVLDLENQPLTEEDHAFIKRQEAIDAEVEFMFDRLENDLPLK